MSASFECGCMWTSSKPAWCAVCRRCLEHCNCPKKQPGPPSKYKSVTELAADNPNLGEYLGQLERRIKALEAEIKILHDPDAKPD